MNKKGFLNSPISFLFSRITIRATEPVNVANNVYFFSRNISVPFLCCLFTPLYVIPKSGGLEVPCAPSSPGQAHFHSGCSQRGPYHQEASRRTGDHPTSRQSDTHSKQITKRGKRYLLNKVLKQKISNWLKQTSIIFNLPRSLCQ